MTTAWKPTGVSFSSGGIRIIGHIGVLAHLLETGDLSHVHDWYGCSGGAITAILAGLGVTSIWLRDFVRHFDPRVFADIEDDAVFNYLNAWGVNTGKALISFMGRLMDTWEPGSSAWTFADFVAHRPGITLNITGANISKKVIAVFNHIHTPKMKIVDAMRVSSTIPLFYTPWYDPSGDIYCDGAVMEYYPWTCLKDRENTLVVVCTDTGISGRLGSQEPIKTLWDYFGTLVECARRQRFIETPKHWIAVNNKIHGVLDFDIIQADRITFFEEGIRAAKGWRAFRDSIKQGSASETHRCSGDRGHPYASSVAHCSPNNMSESPGSHSPAPQQHSSQDLQTSRPRASRRWSL